MAIKIQLDEPYDADVVVAGGGPAGAATAAHLARAGASVIVLDRQAFPRDKVCGDFVGPVGLAELDTLGVTARPEFQQSQIIRTAALHIDGREVTHEPMPRVAGLPDHGRVIPREQFDHWVLEAALESGVRLETGYQVMGYDVDDGGVMTRVKVGKEQRTLRSKILVGADGSSSIVARVLRGHGVLSKDRILAVRAYYEGVATVPDQADLYFSAESFPGYYWLFPTGPQSANVGIGMVRDTLPPNEDHLRELLLDHVQRDPVLRERLKHATMVGSVVGWPLTTYNRSLPSVGDRVVLVGDAAGLINPLNGEGIQYALLSGRWAADTLRVCMQAHDFSRDALAAYERTLARELRLDMALAGMIVQLIRNRDLNPLWLWLIEVISNRAKVDREYARLAGGILSGLLPARSVLTPTMIEGTLSQLFMTAVLKEPMRMLSEPKAGVDAMMTIARMGFQFGLDSLTNPKDVLRWAGAVLEGGVALGTEVAKDFIRQRTPSSHQLNAG